MISRTDLPGSGGVSRGSKPWKHMSRHLSKPDVAGELRPQAGVEEEMGLKDETGRVVSKMPAAIDSILRNLSLSPLAVRAAEGIGT